MDVNITRESKAFVFDPPTFGFDTMYWSKISGTNPTVSGGDLLVNATEIASYPAYLSGDFEFTMNVPAVPTSGDVRAWGLKIPGLGNRGRIEFDITGAVFSLKVYTNAGVALLNQTITWDAAWTATDTVFRIMWQPFGIRFMIGTVTVAKLGIGGNVINSTNPSLPMAIHINNANADNLKISDIVAQNVAHASDGVGAPSITVNIEELPAAAALADATANPTTTTVGADISGWNGTTWDRIKAGITTFTSTLTGFLNVLPWGIYTATPSTRTSGNGSNLEQDSTGNLRAAEQYAPQYEDNTNGVAQVMVKPLASSTYVPTRFQNIGANATLNVKATTGNIFSVYCHNLVAADRWLQLHNTATTPGGAAVPAQSFYIPPMGVLEKGMGDYFSAAGLNYATGIAFAISTTEGTYTAATATDHFTQITYV